jgi:hypothetical protein
MNHVWTLFIVLMTVPCVASAEDSWQEVETSDGVVQGMLPGEARESVNRETTVVGTIVTNIRGCQIEEAEYSVSSTKLSGWIRQFASDEKVYTSARDGLLEKYSASEQSYDVMDVDGVDGRILRYESPEDNLEGVAILFIHKNSIYTANVRFEPGTEEGSIEKFCNSIRIQR